MNFVDKSPGVYVPEMTTPPSVVPEVTISRLMLIGKLPWTDHADNGKRAWTCHSWRDVVNQAQEHFREVKSSAGQTISGQAIVDDLQKNLRWQSSKPICRLKKEFASAESKMLAPPADSPQTDDSPSTGKPTTGKGSSKTEAGLTASSSGLVSESSPATTSASGRRLDLALGDIALTLNALKTYFEHGGGSVVVFDPTSDEDPGVDQELLRQYDIGILCAPGRARVFYDKLRATCGTRDSDPMGDAFCFLLLDSPSDGDKAEPYPKGYAHEDHSSASFGPWLRDGAVEIPASPAVAGAFAACDTAYGPYRAAAGLMFTIKGSWELAARVSDQEAGMLNEKGLNQLRQFGQGQRPVIWGARTLSENIDLQYIPVARVLLALRKAIKLSLRSFVFHPNNRELRQWVYRMLYGYLEDRRRKGWLKGETADQAFTITFPTSVDDEKKGILRVRVEVALARPAEFIEVEITQIQEFTA